MKLEDLVDFNPRTPIAKGESAPFVDMASLPTGDKHFPISAFRVFKGSGSKFKDGDTLLARITPCLENGKGGFVQGLGEGVFSHGSTEFIVLRAKKLSDKDGHLEERVFWASIEANFIVVSQVRLHRVTHACPQAYFGMILARISGGIRILNRIRLWAVVAHGKRGGGSCSLGWPW